MCVRIACSIYKYGARVLSQTRLQPRMRVLVCLLSGLALCQAYDYKEVIRASLLFYEAQRSGKLPADQKVIWRKDSALNDRGQKGEDLTGGYYNSGDHMKFGFPMAFSTTVLAWGVVDYEAGYASANSLDDARKAVKWATDYFIKAHVSPNEFYVQVGLGKVERGYWGRPEDMTMARPAFKIDTARPGSDLAGETAAALAAASIVFKTADPSYSNTLLTHAKQLFDFADKYRGKYTDFVADANDFYPSYSYYDELVWGAVWLYRATGDKSYLTKAESLYDEFEIQYWDPFFGWDAKPCGVQVLLARITGKLAYKNKVIYYCDNLVTSEKKTPKGLVYIEDSGPLRLAANAVFICLQLAELGINTDTYREFAKKQIDYILGDGGRSYVVGFGNNPPTHARHKSSSCPPAPKVCDWKTFYAPDPNYYVVTGALVGGPDSNDNFVDSRSYVEKNEVSTDYNAGFQSALAALVQLKL